MLFNYLKRRAKFNKQKKIARQVRNGILPAGTPKEEIWDALKATKPRNAMECFGFLTAKVTRPDGSLKMDERLVSVREVTSAFADHLADCLTTSGDVLDNFNQHKMGSGSTAETSDLTALVSAQSGAQVATGNAAATHGVTSNIYRTVGTLTAATAFGCREHGVFNASTGGTMMDRNVITNVDLNTDDEVTFIYDLTINPGG